MLWKKERDGCYIDIFAAINPDSPITKLYMEKYIEFNAREYENRENRSEYQKIPFTAKSHCERGKQLFAEEKYVDAMQAFNAALIFSPYRYEEMAFAYANRSACFLHLNMPNECLVDVAWAKISNYPRHLMQNLDDIAAAGRVLKEKNIKPTPFAMAEPALSFAENEKFGGVADCLEIRRNGKFGHHVVTTCDLEIGQTILVEHPFSIAPRKCCGQHFDRCFYCCSKFKNFISCANCNAGFYCNKRCMEKAFHQTDSNMEASTDCKGKFDLVVKTFLNIIDAFPDGNHLMSTVDSLINGNNAANDLTAAQKNFCSIFRLALNDNKFTEEQAKDLRSKSTFAYLAMTPFPQFKEMFITKEQRCFAQHLVLHLFHITEHAIDLYELVRADNTTPMSKYTIHQFASGMYPFGCYINHSCVPNICWYSIDDRLICKVIQPIKKGEQIFRSYFSGVESFDRKTNIKQVLNDRYGFQCTCILCSNDMWTPFVEEISFPQDPLWTIGVAPSQMDIKQFRQLSQETIKKYEQNAIEHLKKYGRLHPIRDTIAMQHCLLLMWIAYVPYY